MGACSGLFPPCCEGPSGIHRSPSDAKTHTFEKKTYPLHRNLLLPPLFFVSTPFSSRVPLMHALSLVDNTATDSQFLQVQLTMTHCNAESMSWTLVG
ncbi:uncharacterized protein N7479_004417 [Penicillium vulpinum]|uniref:uncharacterized protein n=1 Tax=Penicillium vulpinum TaxID=29845 RepID=UPI002549997D|nr:uncharacterized protein N7479_004417 [Penicillium vulpinum]KAJ5964541.1 hypothetical protein N7479_004417 [Penicillium vulpinum]